MCTVYLSTFNSRLVHKQRVTSFTVSPESPAGNCQRSDPERMPSCAATAIPLSPLCIVSRFIIFCSGHWKSGTISVFLLLAHPRRAGSTAEATSVTFETSLTCEEWWNMDKEKMPLSMRWLASMLATIRKLSILAHCAEVAYNESFL